MPLVNKTYTFVNGNVADANQVNSDLDTLYNLVNGNLDSSNFAPNAVTANNLQTETVTPPKTEGIPYAADLFKGTSFIVSGLVPTKDGTKANQLDVTAGVAYVLQPDGSLRRLAPAVPVGYSSIQFTTASTNATYYLDLNHDGSWSFQTGHSTDANYLNVCSVTTDGSGNILTVTPNSQSTTVPMLGGGGGGYSVNSVNAWIG